MAGLRGIGAPVIVVLLLASPRLSQKATSIKDQQDAALDGESQTATLVLGI